MDRQINMSNFGHDLIPTPTSGGTEPSTTDSGGLGGFFSSVVATVESTITDELNDIANDFADKISAELGISQWYSLHIMDVCEGNYSPNATTPGAGYNTTNCTTPQAGIQFNLTATLDHEIDLGPLGGINTADLKIPDGVQEAIDYLNGFLLAVFILFVIGIGFAGISLLLSIVAMTIGSLAKTNALVALLAALALGIGSAITTAIAKKGASEINDKGDDVGISASAGTKFLIISWVSFGTMFLALVAWVAIWIFWRRGAGKRKRGAFKPHAEKHRSARIE